MERESDDFYEGPYRRPLNFGASTGHPARQRELRDEGAGGPYTHAGAEAQAFGPEAYQRAAEMNYEHTVRVQMESPFVSEEIVEHHVHDWRLYSAMWGIAGLSIILALFSFDLSHGVVGVLALGVALYCTPGRQRREDATTRRRNLT